MQCNIFVVWPQIAIWDPRIKNLQPYCQTPILNWVSLSIQTKNVPLWVQFTTPNFIFDSYWQHSVTPQDSEGLYIPPALKIFHVVCWFPSKQTCHWCLTIQGQLPTLKTIAYSFTLADNAGWRRKRASSSLGWHHFAMQWKTKLWVASAELCHRHAKPSQHHRSDQQYFDSWAASRPSVWHPQWHLNKGLGSISIAAFCMCIVAFKSASIRGDEGGQSCTCVAAAKKYSPNEADEMWCSFGVRQDLLLRC